MEEGVTEWPTQQRKHMLCPKETDPGVHCKFFVIFLHFYPPYFTKTSFSYYVLSLKIILVYYIFIDFVIIGISPEKLGKTGNDTEYVSL